MSYLDIGHIIFIMNDGNEMTSMFSKFGGSFLPTVVKRVLAENPKLWDYELELCGKMFAGMVGSKPWTDSYGIGTYKYPLDPENGVLAYHNPHIIIDCALQTVQIGSKTYSFMGYVSNESGIE